MRAVTEYLPIGPADILSPEGDWRTFDRLLAATDHEDYTFYPSARAAIRAALLDAGLDAASEVLIPGYTCYAVRAAVADVATPVYVDVTNAFTMDLNAVEAAITADTRAIVPIHQYGLECDMAAVHTLAEEHDLTVVEDAAQATSNLLCSAQVGTGDYTVLSFRYFKETTAYGGGMLLGSDQPVSATVDRSLPRLKLLGVWGAHQTLRALPGSVYQCLRARVLDPVARASSDDLGPTAPTRVDNWTERILGTQLEDLQDRIECRRANAAIYQEHLPATVTLPPSIDHNTYVRYPVRVPKKRDTVLRRLRRAGIGASPMWAYTIAPERTCPTSHRIAEEILVLPVHTGLSPRDVQEIAATVERVWATI